MSFLQRLGLLLLCWDGLLFIGCLIGLLIGCLFDQPWMLVLIYVVFGFLIGTGRLKLIDSRKNS
jgi:ABC-type uncharacterized transport system permease subunit